jgi:hypothetical protein
MKTVLSSLTAVLLLSAALVRGDEAATNIVGNWRGTLDAGMAKLRVVFVISAAAGGGLKAEMYSPDQSPNAIPVAGVTVDGTTLKIRVPAIHGSYEGALDAAATAAKGQWTQMGQSLPLELVKGPANGAAPTAEEPPPADVAANKAAAEKVAGTWNGTLETGQASLRLRVHITKTGSGAATGTMDSLDQGATGIPIAAIILKDRKLRFEARGIGGVYEGTLSADGTTLAGQWTQGGGTLPLDLQKAKAE